LTFNAHTIGVSPLALALFLAFAPSATAAETAVTIDKSSKTRVLFQAGMDDYARGDLDAALKSFKEVLRREPGNHNALAAVRRLENEIAQRQSTPLPSEKAAPGRFERFLRKLRSLLRR
jgi:outer membrane protein assembly factor BamD (BamD/ComL family)